MHPTQTSRQHQQFRIQKYQSDTGLNGFHSILTSDDLMDEISALSPEYRDRIYPPTNVLSMFLTQAMNADRSCQNIVNQAALQRLTRQQSKTSTRTGAYCRARQKLPLHGLPAYAHGRPTAKRAKTQRLAVERPTGTVSGRDNTHHARYKIKSGKLSTITRSTRGFRVSYLSPRRHYLLINRRGFKCINGAL